MNIYERLIKLWQNSFGRSMIIDNKKREGSSPFPEFC
jgi:hypothetical protein